MPENKQQLTLQQKLDTLKTLYRNHEDVRVQKIKDILGLPHPVWEVALGMILQTTFPYYFETPEAGVLSTTESEIVYRNLEQRFVTFLFAIQEARADFGDINTDDIQRIFSNVILSLTEDIMPEVRIIFDSVF